jgi:hypothetical protein
MQADAPAGCPEYGLAALPYARSELPLQPNSLRGAHETLACRLPAGPSLETLGPLTAYTLCAPRRQL